jgi:hypothetical protein
MSWVCPNCNAINNEQGDCECCQYSGAGLNEDTGLQVFYLGKLKEVEHVC